MALTPTLNDPPLSTPTPRRSTPAWNLALGTATVVLVVLFYAFAVIRNFSGPIGDYSESFLYEYLPWYASRHLTFWPIPHLELHTDQVLYPFGGNVALQSWCVERDILFALLKAHFPQAPLLQIYYLLGVAVSTLGTYLLLLPRHGAVRAALTSLIAHAFNFYSIQKYAGHYNIACYHWTTLGIVCDFVIIERMVVTRAVPLRLLLLRVLLLTLAFGLELGHVLGYSLTSALFSAAYLLWFVRRESKQGHLDLGALFTQWQNEFRSHRMLIFMLSVMTLVVAWLYGSVTAGIVRDSLAMGKFPGNSGTWWAIPLRLLIPYTPWLHPSMQPPFLHVLGDVAENGIGGGGAGLFLLIIAGLGVHQTRAYRLHSPYFPLLLSLLLYVVSGVHLPLLRLLPWFLFCRVYSRATLVYSTIFALLAVDVSLAKKTQRRRVLALLSLGLLGGLELTTIVLIKNEHPTYSFASSQMGYFETVKQLPGEAILDFPFCLTGGNGDLGGLCPYWQKLKGVYALQRFHEKKVLGQYLGRIHPSQVAPFVNQGWDELLTPDSYDLTRATRQRHCFTREEWTFFEQFYLLNDFAGIQLAKDLLAPGCAAEFYARFGQPIASADLAGAGRLELIPKSDSQRRLVDPLRGKQVALVRHDPGRFEQRYTARDLRRSDDRAILLRSDASGQPTGFELRTGWHGVVFGPYTSLPAGEYLIGFDLELTHPAIGPAATLDMIGSLESLETKEFGKAEIDAAQLLGGRTVVELPTRLLERTTRIETRLASKGIGLLLHGITVRRLGSPK